MRRLRKIGKYRSKIQKYFDILNASQNPIQLSHLVRNANIKSGRTPRLIHHFIEKGLLEKIPSSEKDLRIPYLVQITWIGRDALKYLSLSIRLEKLLNGEDDKNFLKNRERFKEQDSNLEKIREVAPHIIQTYSNTGWEGYFKNKDPEEWEKVIMTMREFLPPEGTGQ